MEPYAKGTAKIKDAKTGIVHEIDADELVWDAVDGEEGSMGEKTHYEATVEHDQLGDLTWNLWEYPPGAYNDQETNVGKHEVVEDFDYGLKPDRE